MRVSGKSGATSASSVGGVKPSSGAAPVAATSGTGPVAADALDVSSAAQFFTVAQAQLAMIPEVRSDKVEALKAKLESDSYHPDAEAVADGIVREHTMPRREP